MIRECCHILNSGTKCCAVALRGKRLCRHHATNRKRHAPRPYSRTHFLGSLPELKSPHAVQTTLSQVIRALADNSISVYRAQALITLLQLASKMLR